MMFGKHPARFMMQHNTQSTADLSTEDTAVGTGVITSASLIKLRGQPVSAQICSY